MSEGQTLYIVSLNDNRFVYLPQNECSQDELAEYPVPVLCRNRKPCRQPAEIYPLHREADYPHHRHSLR